MNSATVRSELKLQLFWRVSVSHSRILFSYKNFIYWLGDSGGKSGMQLTAFNYLYRWHKICSSWKSLPTADAVWPCWLSLFICRSLLRISISLICFPFTLVRSVVEDIVSFQRRWKKYAFACEQERRQSNSNIKADFKHGSGKISIGNFAACSMASKTQTMFVLVTWSKYTSFHRSLQSSSPLTTVRLCPRFFSEFGVWSRHGLWLCFCMVA